MVYRRAISHNIFLLEFNVCFCNLRCLVEYGNVLKKTSRMIKKTTFYLCSIVEYTTGMSFFVQSTPAVKPKTKNIQVVSLSAAALFVLMSVAQLFRFEEFPQTIADMWLPGDMSAAIVIAACTVTLEVLALPFLLAMRLSHAMRVVSMVAGWIVIGLWLVILILQNISSSIIANSGLLGATVPIPVGWWMVLVWLALGVLVGWASWGMWPLKSHSAR